MTKPTKPVTVTLSAEDAADLQARVERRSLVSAWALAMTGEESYREPSPKSHFAGHQARAPRP
jgi:hypothetical protein